MSKVTDYEFFPRCFECGGDIKLTPSNGRTREIVRGKPFIIPDEFEIPTCQTCGDEIWSTELSEAIDAWWRNQQ